MIDRVRKTNALGKTLRRNTLLQLTAIGFCCFVLTAEGAVQGAYTDGKAAQLKAVDINKLKALRAPIAVPTYIPTGYKLKGAGGRTEKLGQMWSVDYELTYENAKGDSFAIHSANEGLGDVPINEVLIGKNPFFDGMIDIGTQEEAVEGSGGAKREFESGWIENRRAYIPPGARSRRQAYRITSTVLPAKEVLKIMQSLRYLR